MLVSDHADVIVVRYSSPGTVRVAAEIKILPPPVVKLCAERRWRWAQTTITQRDEEL